MKVKLLTTALLTFILSYSINAQNPYYPLEKGKVWTYEYEEMFSNQSDQMSKIEVLNETKTINGKEYMIMQTSMGSGDNFNVIQTSYARYGDDGAIYSINENSNEEGLVFPGLPISEGKSWTVSQSGFEVTSKVVDMNASLETSKNSFTDCIVIESQQQNTKVRSYVKKGIGMVAIGVFMNGEEMIMQSLVD